jgi:hypothetical protein
MESAVLPIIMGDQRLDGHCRISVQIVGKRSDEFQLPMEFCVKFP